MPAAGPQNTRKAQLRRRKPAPKVKGPTPRQVSQAKQQAQTYVSQGKAVEKVANQQKRAAKVVKRQAKRTFTKEPVKGMTRSERRAVERLSELRTSDPKRYDENVKYAKSPWSKPEAVKARKIAREQTLAPKVAPVLKVLDQTTRPLHGVAGGADAAITGKNVPKAVLRGVKNEDKTTFSTVLKHAGVHNKTVRGVAGFVGDVALDPTTYVTGGTSSLARKGAEKAATDATKKAVAKGLTKEQADRFGERAARQAMKGASTEKGATVKFAGKEVPGVTKATAKATKPVKKVIRKVTPDRAKDVVADVNPNAVPRGVTREVSDKAVNATRTARGKINTAERDAVAVAHGIRKQVGEENYNRVVDAIEAGNLRSLPDDLAKHAHRLRSEFKGVRRVQRRSGVKVADATKGGQVKGYVYRQLTDEAAEADAKKLGRSGGTKPASSKARKEKRPLAVVRNESPGRYREDLHALSAERLAHGHTSAAKATLNRDLADLGRPVRRGENPDLKEGEAVFHVKGSEIVEVTDKKEVERISRPLRMNKAGTKLKGANKQGGRYVVLNREIVERAKEGSVPTLKGPGIVHAFDKATGGFKRIALATPGFHIRNLIGDTAQAYVGQPGHKLPGNLRRSGKVLKALGEKESAKQDLRPVNVSGHTLKTSHYGELPLEEVADNLVKHGAARSGYTARELNELAASGGKKAPGKIRRGMKRVGQTKPATASKRALLNREDLPRIATAIHALQNGATWEEASREVADVHFDFAHLTSFERNVARRLLPFYTWSARNIPFTAKNVIARPGKYANIQKVREEAVIASGVDQQDQKTRDLYKQLAAAGVALPKGWQKGLSEWEQRNAGVPVSWKGQKFTVSFGLPLQDLNEFPGAAGKGQAAEYYQKGMSLLNPIIKDPVEYFENHSFFFRDELQRSYSPNVAAPGWVGKLPPAARKNLQVVKIQDKKSGKMVWGWPAKMDYIAKAVPGTPNYLQQISTAGADRRGKTTGGKALAFAGVKSVPYDPVKNAVNLAYARQQEIQEKLAGLRQQGIGLTKGKRPTAEYLKLNDQLKIVNKIAYQGKVSQGYKVLPTQGGPSKSRVQKRSTTTPTTGRFNFGSSSSGGSSSSPSSGGRFKFN